MQLGMSEQSFMLGFSPSTILSKVAPGGVGTASAFHRHSKLEKFRLQNFYSTHGYNKPTVAIRDCRSEALWRDICCFQVCPSIRKHIEFQSIDVCVNSQMQFIGSSAQS